MPTDTKDAKTDAKVEDTKAKAATASAKSDTAAANKVKADHAKAGANPMSPTEDPTDHSVGGARAAAAAKDAETAEQDNSPAGKMARSGLFFVRDHSRGTEYVGISPAADPDADFASKTRSLVAPISGVAPRTGMQVNLDGYQFVVGENFGPDSTPDDWMKVLRPDNGKSIFD